MPSAVLSIPAYLVTHGRLAGVACGRLDTVPFLLAFITAADLSVLLEYCVNHQFVGVVFLFIVCTTPLFPLYVHTSGSSGEFMAVFCHHQPVILPLASVCGVCITFLGFGQSHHGNSFGSLRKKPP